MSSMGDNVGGSEIQLLVELIRSFRDDNAVAHKQMIEDNNKAHESTIGMLKIQNGRIIL